MEDAQEPWNAPSQSVQSGTPELRNNASASTLPRLAQSGPGECLHADERAADRTLSPGMRHPLIPLLSGASTTVSGHDQAPFRPPLGLRRSVRLRPPSHTYGTLPHSLSLYLEIIMTTASTPIQGRILLYDMSNLSVD
ncbi:hypothetical protein VTN96DRAFT_420 [Rasamsonia emersonii]